MHTNKSTATAGKNFLRLDAEHCKHVKVRLEKYCKLAATIFRKARVYTTFHAMFAELKEGEIAYGSSWKRSARERRSTLLAIFASCERVTVQEVDCSYMHSCDSRAL